MTVFTRRNALLTGVAGLASLAAVPALVGTGRADEATTHEIKMLNKHPDNNERMVFYPSVVRVKVGDTVKFLPENPGHNSASTRGAIPAGAEAWKGRINKELEVTMTVPGFYAYNCTPHRASGMVGMIIVEGPGMMDNMEKVKKTRQVGKAKKVWESIWETAEAEGMLADYEA
ncbi:MAG: pseudoazurin [Pseudomonadota bacterium]